MPRPRPADFRHVVIDLNALPTRLRRAPACAYLNAKHGIDLTPRALIDYDHRGDGPEMCYVLGRATYTTAALDAWAESRVRPAARRGT